MTGFLGKGFPTKRHDLSPEPIVTSPNIPDTVTDDHHFDIPDGVVSCVLMVCTYQPNRRIFARLRRKMLNNIDTPCTSLEVQVDRLYFLNGLPPMVLICFNKVFFCQHPQGTKLFMVGLTSRDLTCHCCLSRNPARPMTYGFLQTISVVVWEFCHQQ